MKNYLLHSKATLFAAFLFLTMCLTSPALYASASQSIPKAETGTMSKTNPNAYSFANPDFAFPETVEKNAEGRLKEAVGKKNGVEALQAGIQVVVARSLISNSSFRQSANMLDSVAGIMPQPYKSLFLLLEATMYQQLYNSEQWTYNGRTLPLNDYPEDVKAWSGDLFAKKVSELVQEATDNLEQASQIPLSELLTVVTPEDAVRKSGLTVADFIVSKGVDLLRNFESFSIDKVIPFRKDMERSLLSPGELCLQEADKLTDRMIVSAEENNNLDALTFFILRKSEPLYHNEKTDFLKSWLKKLYDTPKGGALLCAYYDAVTDSRYIGTADSKLLYSQMLDWISKYPDSEYVGAVKYDLAKLAMKNASVSAVSQMLPGVKSNCTMTVNNVNDIYALVYKVPETMIKNNGIVLKKFPGAAECVLTIPMKFEGEVPFSASAAFDMPELESGSYVIIPSASAKLSANWRNDVDKWSVSLFHVTNLSIIAVPKSSQVASGVAYVVDAATQRPIEGAVMTCRDNGNNKVIKSGVTDKNGAFILPEGYFNIEARKDGNVATAWCGNNYSKPNVRKDNRVNFLTDLSIYKPGDQVQFALVAWTAMEDSASLMKNTDLKAVLLDANGNDVDSLSLTTDNWGRTNGRFTLPKSGLLGTYQLAAELKNNPRRRIGYQGFEVAEYKAPSFYVELKSDSSENYIAGDTLKFKGEVKTYSGMPLAGVEVKYNVRWSPWWRWYFTGNTASYGSSVVSDENGGFMIELPTANLKGTEYEQGIYTLSASATSQSGETQTAPDLRFALGKDYVIRPQITDKTKVDGNSVRLNVPAYDMLDFPVVKDIEYNIVRVSDGEKVSSGVFASPVLNLEASKFPSGKYRMEFNVEGDTLKTVAETVFFRENDTKVPVETPLWLTEDKIIAKDGAENVQVKVGSGFPGSYILCIVSAKNGIESREWLKPNNGVISVNVVAPKGKDEVLVTFSGMHDFVQSVQSVKIVTESSQRKMNVQTSVFRNKISTGDKEQWKFIFAVDKEMQIDIPAFAVMSDKSLNALMPFKWSFKAYGFSRGLYINVSQNYLDRFTTSAHFSKLPKYVGINETNPNWNTYNYGLVNNVSNLRKYKTRTMNAAPTSGAISADGVVDEMYVEEDAQEAPMMFNAKVESVAAADLAENKVVSADGGDAASTADVEMRPVEMPLMFFMPDLKANEQGEVTVDFVVPNFNTTWQFQLLGYNEELMTASTILDAVASKPVMVRSNPPRFVRTGDKVQLAATLFNNTDDVLGIEGMIELFNPITEEVIISRKFDSEDVETSGNRTVSLQFDVTDNLSAIGIRSYALSGHFSDGEQTVIPVLPSSTPVVESTQFYLKTGETDFSVKLPEYPKDANITLKYCDNPIWECLLALPSISTPDSKNVFSVMKALFANSMSLNIVDKYPSVKDGLEKVIETGDSTVLTSNLQKDADLKTVELNNTPWVNDARAETERMRSLDKLLDKEAGETAVNTLLKDLKDLQTAEGGWSWCPGMKASEFITRSIILDFGIMKRVGCLPKEAESMIKDAVNYCDKMMYDNYLKSDKKFSTIDMLGYLYARSFFDVKSKTSGFDGLRSKALKKISEEWKQFSIYNKAIAAMLLSRSDGYGKTARVVLESLNQYASKDVAKGWWFDNLRSGFNGMPKLLTTATALDAYSEIEPGTDAVEGLRQWLVLQKETENWGANSYTVEVIGAIMGSGVDWASTSEPASISVNGKEIDMEGRESLAGLVTVNLDPSQVSGKDLTVSKKSTSPAWGGVISQYVAPIKEVKAEKSANLKIEKKLLVVNDTPSGVVAKEGEIHVGDKVRVTLTLTCDKDMQYVALIDERGAFLEPVEQISDYSFRDGLAAYQETRDTRTSFFIEFLPKGVNVITYDCYADREGEYSVGIASVQSQYSPLQTAHSAGQLIRVF